ncbi:hypothetical protein [Thermoactinomyces sp. DSM 45892]|uniref:hypothetical protein n=1 Tax=Thermoactinomyces sp. DSM 45892 TaxID=1882753 RepID=UPI0011601A30|nr:hypothetical protein [Thermoactinomyces sp. DSM 45892]
MSKMTSDEDKQIRESAVQYIKERYQKELVITKVTKGRILGDYGIEGTIKDGKNTPVVIVSEPPKGFHDSYVKSLFSDELEPSMKELANRTFDLRMVDRFTYGYKKDAERKYTGQIPSVFDVLKKGDKDLVLHVDLSVYQQAGQAQKVISQFLHELKKMNFNDIGIVVYVYDDSLKSASKKEDSDKYLLERYNIFTDVQTMDINNLESYKTVIKK